MRNPRTPLIASLLLTTLLVPCAQADELLVVESQAPPPDPARAPDCLQAQWDPVGFAAALPDLLVEGGTLLPPTLHLRRFMACIGAPFLLNGHCGLGTIQFSDETGILLDEENNHVTIEFGSTLVLLDGLIVGVDIGACQP